MQVCHLLAEGYLLDDIFRDVTELDGDSSGSLTFCGRNKSMCFMELLNIHHKKLHVKVPPETSAVAGHLTKRCRE